MHKFILLFFSALSFLQGCKSSSAPASDQSIDEKIMAITGAGYTITKNESASFALCTKASDVSLAYTVVRISDMKIVIQESIAKGSVTWNGDLKIQVSTVPGIIKKDELGNENNRIIDLSPFILHEN